MDVSSLKYVVSPRSHYYAARTQRDASSYCPFIRYFINSTPIAHRLSVLAFPNSPPTTVPMDGGLKPSRKLARYLIDVNGASEKMHGIWANASSRRLRIMYRLFACHTHTQTHTYIRTPLRKQRPPEGWIEDVSSLRAETKNIRRSAVYLEIANNFIVCKMLLSRIKIKILSMFEQRAKKGLLPVWQNRYARINA